MIVNKYSNGGGGGTDVNTVKMIVDSALTEYTYDLIDGEPVVGMAAATDKLSALSAFPTSAETGDVVALNIEGQGLPNGILFEERNDLGDDNDKSGGRFQFPIDGFDGTSMDDPVYVGKVTISTEYAYSYDMYAYKDETTLVFALTSDENLYDADTAIYMTVGSDEAGYNLFANMVMDYHYTESTDEYYVVDIFPETTGSVSFDLDITEGQLGVYQYDGTDWNQLGTGGSGGSQNIIILDDLTGTGEEGKLYLYGERLMRWVNGAGRWGKWIIGMDNNISNAGDACGLNKGYFSANSYLAYTYLPFSGAQLLCQIKSVSANGYIQYVPTENKLKCFGNSSFTGTPIAEVTMNGVEVEVLNYSGRKMFITWTNGLIKFRSADAFVLMNGNYVSTDVSTSHWEAFDVDDFDGTSNFNNTAGGGFAVCNSEGKVTNIVTPTAKMLKLNNTGFTSYFTVYGKGFTSVPDYWFFPTQGGTAGQVLTSNGNAEPVWTSWIKSVKITSAAYEALVQEGTTNPNTLYLIVDE